MELKDSYRIVKTGSYKISLEKHLEDNRKKLLEHYRRLHNEHKLTEQRKQQEVNSFICDWQQS